MAVMSNPTESAQSVIDAYIEGTRTRDVGLLKAVFAEGAVMVGWLGPDLLTGGPEPFYGALEANEVGDDYAARSTVEVTERIATATIEEQNLLGMNFTNHFQIVQLADGSWRIAAKLFRHH